ncbi:hypothetical protein LGK97_10315 [Clostridium sp. CS001]|jgi:hypothetical protein|uniref:hypothetical protein n=1 Tax=Clostridium sp. CS001 TaxID=2880648 RepID=UPI001CF40946|nr:hypothetical protein [Clostridium sp. CS001]MCB2290161.1 hypothetical protein [Clostridium sp. CS001]
MNLLIESIVVNILLTAFVWIGTKDDKTKLKGFYYYPKEIRERILAIPEYKKYIPKESARKVNFISSFLLFIVIFLVCSIFNGTNSFWASFENSIVLGVVMNLYDLLILDILWFSNAKRPKITGTEDMTKEYHNPKVHVEAFFRGVAMTFVGAFLVGAIFTIL